MVIIMENGRTGKKIDSFPAEDGHIESVFIDESGDFGEITERPAYYLVTLLFHD